jgi:hypothetical protein
VKNTTSGSFVATAIGSPIGVSGVFTADGFFRSLASGEPIDIDPLTATYRTQRSVMHAVKSYGLRFDGGTVSAARISGINDKGMTLAEAIAHPFLGETMPTLETIAKAYSPDAIAKIA